jgi:hypothetical protein
VRDPSELTYEPSGCVRSKPSKLLGARVWRSEPVTDQEALQALTVAFERVCNRPPRRLPLMYVHRISSARPRERRSAVTRRRRAARAGPGRLDDPDEPEPDSIADRRAP